MSDYLPDELDTAPAGFAAFSDTGIILSANRTLAVYLGYLSGAELEGAHIEEIFSVAGKIFYHTHLFPLVRIQLFAEEIFLDLKKKDGEKIPVVCNIVRKENEGLFSNHCVFVPVWQRRKFEDELIAARQEAEATARQNEKLSLARQEADEKLIQADRQFTRLLHLNDELSQFSRIISHDLQEAIRKIALLADRVHMDAGDRLAPESVQRLERINGGCRQLRELAISLNSFISLNLADEEPRTINLPEIIPAVFEKVHGNSAKLHDGNLPCPEGFPDQLATLFVNIFENQRARAAGSKTLEVKIECTPLQHNSFHSIAGQYRYIEFYRIDISDNAAPPDFESAEQLFRLHKPGAWRSGFSAGLAMAKKIADNHFGQLTARLNSDGYVVFSLMLPAKQESGPAVPQP